MKKLLMFAVLAALAFSAVACGPPTATTSKPKDTGASTEKPSKKD